MHPPNQQNNTHELIIIRWLQLFSPQFFSSAPSTIMQVPMEILHNHCCPNLVLSLLMLFMVAVSAVDPFSQALLSLKSELIHHPNTLNDWVLPSSVANTSGKIYACSWSGVKCNSNSTTVIGLDLSVKNLGGKLSGKQFNIFTDLIDFNISHNSFSENLPVGIFNLTSLRTLDISRNNFSGHFPFGISNLEQLVVLDAFSNSFSGPLPAEISQIQTLKVVNFAGSYFSGPIPSEYGSFKSLEFIHLAGNSLTGEIPPELGNLKTVIHMEIGYNSYEGSIPWQFGNMSELQYLDIAGANLSGPIPKQFSNLTKLESLFLFRNQLNGFIPWEFSKLISLKSLDLSDNQLSGYLPDSFSELQNLTLLSVMYNDLSGTVPDGIAKLPQLDTLLLWNNFFSGSLPLDLGRYSKLKYVDVSTNNFIGRIPPDICVGGMLMKLILFSNEFSGELYPSLSNCSSLVRLRLEDNSFSGEISLKFSSLPDLSYVDLSRNRLTGGIPNDIAKASKLEYFNVSNNPVLGGMIPGDTWSLPFLQNFSAASCSISGSIPSFERCQSVFVIDLSVNNISGVVPDSISNCEALVQMDLSNNNLTGHLPVGLARLPAITLLDLSHNMFSGPLPPVLGNSSSLKLLNISFNDISGSIPQEKSFRMMDSTSFIGNPKLCGVPLRSCHRGNGMSNGLELGSRRTQKFAWVLITCGVIVLFVTTAVFGLFYFRRGTGGQWKMVSFCELPQFTAKDVLRSFNSIETVQPVLALPYSCGKAVLPTGISISVKKIEWEPKRMSAILQLLNRMGSTRHKNLTSLLGFCYNRRVAYLLYDCLANGNLAEKINTKRDWATKYKIILGIARGLCFLHHDCVPAIAHGDLRAENIQFNENMEPHLAEYGLNSLINLKKGSFPATINTERGEFGKTIKEQLHMDIHNFGELVLEILTNGRLKNAETMVQSTPQETLLRDIINENDIGLSNSLQEEIKAVLEVALLCTRSRPENRPSMEEVLKFLQPQGK